MTRSSRDLARERRRQRGWLAAVGGEDLRVHRLHVVTPWSISASRRSQPMLQALQCAQRLERLGRLGSTRRRILRRVGRRALVDALRPRGVRAHRGDQRVDFPRDVLQRRRITSTACRIDAGAASPHAVGDRGGARSPARGGGPARGARRAARMRSPTDRASRSSKNVIAASASQHTNATIASQGAHEQAGDDHAGGQEHVERAWWPR